MGAMRAAAGALLAVTLLVGCGSSAKPAGNLGTDAAELVPPTALAFISVDTNLRSKEWKSVLDVIGPLGLPIDDLKPALGDQLDLAVLEVDEDEPRAIALVHPKDKSKLRALVSKLGPEYSVHEIGDWSVVAESEAEFAEVRRAESGRSLADMHWFGDASGEFSGDALAMAYADGAGLARLPQDLGALVRAAGSPAWVAARLAGDDDAIRLELHADGLQPAPPLYRPRLLDEVPSGALLAVSFKDAHLFLERLAGDPGFHRTLGELHEYLGIGLAELTPALPGEGVLYLMPGVLLPTVVLELDSPSPEIAARTLEEVAGRVREKTGSVLSLKVVARGNRVFLTNASAPPSLTGGRLVDDQAFKDALAAADAPDEVTWLAYADIHRLVPIVQALSQLLGGAPDRQTDSRRLDRLGTLVAFGARSGSLTRVELRLTSR
jgi:hypothetical protein